MSIAGLTLAIFAVILSILWLYGALIALPCLAVGLILSGVDLPLSKKRGRGIHMPLIGIITNIVAFFLIILVITPIAVGFALTE